MRNDFGTRPYKSRFPYKKAKGGSAKRQGYNARLDESLGARTGAESTKSQSLKARRDESKDRSKAGGVQEKNRRAMGKTTRPDEPTSKEKIRATEKVGRQNELCRSRPFFNQKRESQRRI